MFCANCGFKLRDGAKFCTRCGTAVENIVKSEPEESARSAPTQNSEQPPVFPPIARPGIDADSHVSAPSRSSDRPELPIDPPTIQSDASASSNGFDSLKTSSDHIAIKSPEEAERLNEVEITENTSQKFNDQIATPAQSETNEKNSSASSFNEIVSPPFSSAPELNEKEPAYNNETSNDAIDGRDDPGARKTESHDQTRRKLKKANYDKNSPGIVILSVFLSILLFLFSAGASAVGIARNALDKENVSKTIEAVCDNSDELSNVIYGACKRALGNNISNHPELTEESVRNAIEAVRNDKSLNKDVIKYLTAYTEYAVNGGRLNGIRGDDIVSLIKRINSKSHVYDLSQKDISELREVDFSSVSKISKALDFDASMIRYPISEPAYAILIVLAVGMAILILCAGSWKPRAVFTYVSATMTILGSLLLLASGTALALSFAGDAAWIIGSARHIIFSAAVRGGIYFIVGLSSALIAKAVRKKRAA